VKAVGLLQTSQSGGPGETFAGRSGCSRLVERARARARESEREGGREGYIYIYIERERDREGGRGRERERGRKREICPRGRRSRASQTGIGAQRLGTGGGLERSQCAKIVCFEYPYLYHRSPHSGELPYTSIKATENGTL